MWCEHLKSMLLFVLQRYVCMLLCVYVYLYIYIQTYMLAYKHIHICVYAFLLLNTLLMDRQTRNWKQSLSLGRGIM